MHLVNEFLQQCRSSLKSALATDGQASLNKTIHCVLGNEAGDLDSVVCAIVYGLHQTRVSQVVHLPVVNIPRKDLPLRTEVTFVFKLLGVQREHLIFLDEIDLAHLHSQKKLALTLVDHNRLAVSQEDLASAVEGIIDHHKDEKLFSQAKPRVVETVGSCASLVQKEIERAGQGWPFDKETAKLLLSPILVDTINLQEQYGRTTQGDRDAAGKLTSVILEGSSEGHQEFQDSLFKPVQAAKFDISSLSTYDLLRKDYKEVVVGPKQVRLGVSSVTMSLNELLGKDARAAKSLHDYCLELSLDLLVVMTMYNPDDPHRELLVYFPKQVNPQLLSFLESAETDLQLEKQEVKIADVVELANPPVAYHQRNNKLSRKAVLPFLVQFYSK